MTDGRPRTTYVLIHGAAADSWCWRPLDAELRARGHDVVAVDLPCDDDSAGFAEYADAVVEAIGARTDLVVVAHSLGGFTAPIVCERVAVDLLVMLQAMVPSPGEPPGDWWENTGFEQARRAQAERDGVPDDDPIALFLHRTPPELAVEFLQRERGQSGTPFEDPYPLDAWPDVPTRFLLSRDDRFFPAEFLRRVVRDRLHITPEEMPGDHCPMLESPEELAGRLEAYRAELDSVSV